MTTGNMDVGRRAEMIARRAGKIARREDCPTTLGERGGGGAMAIAPPRQPHNAVPLQPVSAFGSSRTSVVGSTYQATPPASSSSAASYVPPARSSAACRGTAAQRLGGSASLWRGQAARTSSAASCGAVSPARLWGVFPRATAATLGGGHALAHDPAADPARLGVHAPRGVQALVPGAPAPAPGVVGARAPTPAQDGPGVRAPALVRVSAARDRGPDRVIAAGPARHPRSTRRWAGSPRPLISSGRFGARPS